MSIRVGINGFGRIGRNFFRAVVQEYEAGLLKNLGHLIEGDHIEIGIRTDAGWTIDSVT